MLSQSLGPFELTYVGQGISILVRAAHVSAKVGDRRRFWNAAGRAVEPFNHFPAGYSDTKKAACGVRANFLGQKTLPWYEEYPAKPSVFVLNGFVFSLIGLFDFSKVSNIVRS